MRTVPHNAIPWGVAAIAQLFVCAGCGEKPYVRDADYPVYWNERIYKGEGIYCVGVGYTASEEGQPIRPQEPQGESIIEFRVYNGIKADIFLFGWTEPPGFDPYVGGSSIRTGDIVGSREVPPGLRRWRMGYVQGCAYLPRSNATVGEPLPVVRGNTYPIRFKWKFPERTSKWRSTVSFQRPALYYVRGRREPYGCIFGRTLVFEFDPQKVIKPE